MFQQLFTSLCKMKMGILILLETVYLTAVPSVHTRRLDIIQKASDFKCDRATLLSYCDTVTLLSYVWLYVWYAFV